MGNNDNASKIISLIIKCIVFIGCLALIIIFHPKTGHFGLLMQLLGLGGLVTLLYVYNRPYSK